MEAKRVDIGQAFGYGWQSIKKDFWYFVGLALVLVIINGVTNKDDDSRTSMNLIGGLLSVWLTCGLLRSVLDYYDGKKREFSVLFTQLQYFWRMLLATFGLGIIIAIGFALFIIPGIYLALRFQFVWHYIVDKNVSVGEAMRLSTELTKGIKMSLLGFALTAFGVMILGAIVLGVGILVATPVIWLAYVYLYRHLLQSQSTVAISQAA